MTVETCISLRANHPTARLVNSKPKVVKIYKRIFSRNGNKRRIAFIFWRKVPNILHNQMVIAENGVKTKNKSQNDE